ncbi:MBL fold metallo-hydrolase [Amycolatopsis taiwanensis]|uniref:MBL fold metallo-hydrolase n=1 Tax=Amycolatopsis taiwanensis TaxID=342230 RepID=A0A9W6QY70_9PSEU|nr:MBL fold metallo-hydrolase [Amycolatopsis taiwanensis]GLY65898.1 MBL fold metallo-hydrolase [Amycolatopsis taiwanensis]
MELSPNLHRLRVEGFQLYLWHDADRLTLIDAGPPGSAAAIAEAIRGLGFSLDKVTSIVLTHFHIDHAGSAAELRELSGAEVLAHAGDVPFLQGKAPPRPVLEDWERPLFEQVTAESPDIAPPWPTPVDRALTGGEVLDFGDGARVLSVPGHTDGSIAVHLPKHRALFTGDTIANVNRVMLGTFNLDKGKTIESMRSLAELEVDLACFGHGDPIVSGAGERLREAAATL